MEYEVGLKLYERVKKGSKLVALLEEEPLKTNQVSFKFADEYWNDELRTLPLLAQVPVHRGDGAMTAVSVLLTGSPARRRPFPSSRTRSSRGNARSRISSTSCGATSSRSIAASTRPRSSSRRAATRPTCPTCSSGSPALRREEPLRVLPAGRDAPGRLEGCARLARDQALQTEGDAD